jgi:membrane associated rhomboid family serine protease
VVVRPPRELGGEFWGLNVPQIRQIDAQYVFTAACCPCCVGPCCSDNRKGDWLRLPKTATFWLLVAQIVTYVVTVAESDNVTWQLVPGVEVLLNFGANSREKVQCHGHYHRLLSYIMLHGSVFHIIFNAMAEFFFVLGMEHGWGIVRFLVIYVGSGITGGLLSDTRAVNVSVGASCAIIGVLGAHAVLIVMFWPGLPHLFKVNYLVQLVVVPVLFLAVSFLPNVDWLGHLGGLIGGAGLGALIFIGKAEASHRKWYIAGGIGAIVVLLAVSFSVIYATGNCA